LNVILSIWEGFQIEYLLQNYLVIMSTVHLGLSGTIRNLQLIADIESRYCLC